MRRPSGSWRSVAVWAVLILVATTVPFTDLVLRTPTLWLDKLVHGVLYLVLGWLVGAAFAALPFLFASPARWKPIVALAAGLIVVVATYTTFSRDYARNQQSAETS